MFFYEKLKVEICFAWFYLTFEGLFMFLDFFLSCDVIIIISYWISIWTIRYLALCHEVLIFFFPFSDSEDSDNESTLETRAHLMEDVDLVESSLAQLTDDHLLNTKVFRGVYNLYFSLLLTSTHCLACKYECIIHFISSWHFVSISHVLYLPFLKLVCYL